MPKRMGCRRARRELAKIANGRFFSMTVNFNFNLLGSTEVWCTAYIDGGHVYTDRVWEVIIAKCKEQTYDSVLFG